jgi:hypothetical protein
VEDETEYDPITGACRQTAIAVRVRLLPRGAEAAAAKGE